MAAVVIFHQRGRGHVSGGYLPGSRSSLLVALFPPRENTFQISSYYALMARNSSEYAVGVEYARSKCLFFSYRIREAVADLYPLLETKQDSFSCLPLPSKHRSLTSYSSYKTTESNKKKIRLLFALYKGMF